MRVSQGQLLALLENNVLEIRFYRRNTKQGHNAARRMLITNDRQLLNSAPGRLALLFKPPTHAPAYNWRTKNLACGWDLLWQAYRMVPVESCNVVTIMPSKPPEKFWEFFSAYLQGMSPTEKAYFMDN